LAGCACVPVSEPSFGVDLKIAGLIYKE
jgi:hypothetical protein